MKALFVTTFDWEGAACQSHQALFLSTCDAVDGGGLKEVEAAEDACKAICSTCPKRPECEEYSQMLDPRTTYGVFAGTTRKDRLRRLRLRR